MIYPPLIAGTRLIITEEISWTKESKGATGTLMYLWDDANSLADVMMDIPVGSFTVLCLYASQVSLENEVLGPKLYDVVYQ